MTRRLVGPIAFGVIGTAILLALGMWQLQRLEWKQAVLAEIEARISAAPVAIPEAPDPTADRFLPVVATGQIAAEAIRVVTTADGGPAFRVISPFRTDGRSVLLDRGVIPAGDEIPPPPAGPVEATGNLHWPDEADSFTPPPERDEGLWYARDVDGMAAELGTEPLLVVARDVPGDAVRPRPISTAGIANDHLEYAITWFSLAAVWAGMTLALVWRIRRRIG